MLFRGGGGGIHLKSHFWQWLSLTAPWDLFFKLHARNLKHENLSNFVKATMRFNNKNNVFKATMRDRIITITQTNLTKSNFKCKTGILVSTLWSYQCAKHIWYKALEAERYDQTHFSRFFLSSRIKIFGIVVLPLYCSKVVSMLLSTILCLWLRSC